MRFTTSLPPIPGAPDLPQPEALHAAHPVRAVRERLFPARIGNAAAHHEIDKTPPPIEKPIIDEENDRRSGKDRRNYCRRITPFEPLMETRSRVERRRKSRRRGDSTTSIDETI